VPPGPRYDSLILELAALRGLEWPAAGRLVVDGQEADPALRELRRSIAWVAPEVTLWRASQLEKLGHGSGEPEAGASGGRHMPIWLCVEMLDQPGARVENGRNDSSQGGKRCQSSSSME
jgi:hypothetical protein